MSDSRAVFRLNKKASASLFTAPEVLRAEESVQSPEGASAADMWSLGSVLLYALSQGRTTPFRSTDEVSALQCIHATLCATRKTLFQMTALSVSSADWTMPVDGIPRDASVAPPQLVDLARRLLQVGA